MTSLPSCDEYFSVSNLAGLSLETEVAYSTLCVQNRLKAAVFICATVFFFLWFCLSVVLLAREYMAAKTWTWKVQGFILVCTTSASN